MTHELDNAAYYALIGPQTRFAERLGGALRYHPDVSGFCALPDEPTPDDWNNLAALAGDEVVLFRDRLEVPASWSVVSQGVGRQYVAGPAVAARSESVTALTSDDVPAMVDLVARARPGPFRERTIELGNYYGHWIDGRLAAMAGHRFHLNGYREISAVCTDAAFRGRGLSTELVRHLTALTEADGDAAFLHVSASNGAAIALYERLGFTLRRQVAFGALRPPVVTS